MAVARSSWMCASISCFFHLLCFYPTVQVKKCQLTLTSALHKNCPGQTALSAPRVQPTQPWAEGQDTSRALQGSCKEFLVLSQLPSSLMNCKRSRSLPIQRALWHPQLQLLSKKVISQGKALQPFLGTWEGTMIMVVQLKARKTHSEKETDGIIKIIYIYIYT